MKRKKLLLLLFFACTQLAFGQITFQKEFQEFPSCNQCYPYVIPNDIKETYDSGYIVAGSVGDTLPFVSPFLMKLDSNGDTLWTKYSVTGWSVLQACDSGYIVAGSGGITNSNSGMSKTDRNGNLLWSKSYPSIPVGQTATAIRTNDCGYILASATDSFGAGGYDMYIIKTDTGGNPLWSRTYGGTGDDEASAIQQTADGGYIIGGYTNSFGLNGDDDYLIKTDVNGDTLWTKTYHKGQYATVGVSSIQQTYDHGYIILGDYLIKTDSMGNVMWSNTFSGGPIYQTPDSGYIFLSNFNGSGGSDLLLFKISSAGNLLWARDFPGPLSGEGYRVPITFLPTNDGGYIITDYTQLTSNTGGANYIDLNKTDANGQSRCNETNTTVSVSTVAITASGTATVVTSPVTTVTASSVNSGTQSISIYTACSTTGIPEPRIAKSPIIFPNPISPDGSLTIFLNEDLKNADLTVFNVTGQPLYTEKVNGKEQIVLDALKNRLSSGMYFIRILQGDNMMVVKFVVVD